MPRRLSGRRLAGRRVGGEGRDGEGRGDWKGWRGKRGGDKFWVGFLRALQMCAPSERSEGLRRGGGRGDGGGVVWCGVVWLGGGDGGGRGEVFLGGGSFG